MYKQIVREQRYQIAAYKKMGIGATAIAKELGVNKSTISRELKRNGKRRSYDRATAQLYANDRKKDKPVKWKFSSAMQNGKCINGKPRKNLSVYLG